MYAPPAESQKVYNPMRPVRRIIGLKTKGDTHATNAFSLGNCISSIDDFGPAAQRSLGAYPDFAATLL